MKCVKKYSEGGALPPGRGRKGKGSGVDYMGRGHRPSRQCREVAEEKSGGKKEPKVRPPNQPKVKPLKLNKVPLQPPKTGIPERTKEEMERAKQQRHSNPRFL